MRQALHRLFAGTIAVGLAGALVMTPATAPAAHGQETGAAQAALEAVVPTGFVSTGDGATRVLSSNWQTLAATTTHTYTFDYAGDNGLVRVWMNVLPGDGANFQVWTSDMVSAQAAGETVEPVGVGTPIGDVAGFLMWEGSAAAVDAYVVTVNSTLTDTAAFTDIAPAAETTVAEAITDTATTDTDDTDDTDTTDTTGVIGTVAPAATLNAVYLLSVAGPGLAVEQTGLATGIGGPVAEVDPTIATVTTQLLNVRTGPSTIYDIITTVPGGTEMTVLGRNAANTWLWVQLGDAAGTQGWVTRLLTDYTAVAEVVDVPELPGLAAGAQTTATTTATATAGITATAGVTATGGTTDTTGADAGGVTPVPGEGEEITGDEAEQALGANWEILGGGESTWYVFQHQGGGLPVNIWLDAEPNEPAGFRIYNQENADAIRAGADPEDTEDIGRGTPNPVEPGYLFWQGNFEEAGPFYVLVMNDSPDGIFYSITAAGPGLARPAPDEGEAIDPNALPTVDPAGSQEDIEDGDDNADDGA